MPLDESRGRRAGAAATERAAGGVGVVERRREELGPLAQLLARTRASRGRRRSCSSAGAARRAARSARPGADASPAAASTPTAVSTRGVATTAQPDVVERHRFGDARTSATSARAPPASSRELVDDLDDQRFVLGHRRRFVGSGRRSRPPSAARRAGRGRRRRRRSRRLGGSSASSTDPRTRSNRLPRESVLIARGNAIGRPRQGSRWVRPPRASSARSASSSVATPTTFMSPARERASLTSSVGTIMSFAPARRAVTAFCFTPPTRPTDPSSPIVPVMATFLPPVRLPGVS